MVQYFACPGCGESENLTGNPSPDGIRIRCGKCDTSWLRDAGPEKCAGFENNSQPLTDSLTCCDSG